MELDLARATQKQLEEVIQDNIYGFLQAGKALALIRDRKLWYPNFDSFDAYLKYRWTSIHGFMNKSRAYQLIEAAEVHEDLVTNGNQIENERQARELVNVPREERNDVYEAAKALAGGKPPSSTQIAQAKSTRYSEHFDDHEPETMRLVQEYKPDKAMPKRFCYTTDYVWDSIRRELLFTVVRPAVPATGLKESKAKCVTIRGADLERLGFSLPREVACIQEDEEDDPFA